MISCRVLSILFIPFHIFHSSTLSCYILLCLAVSCHILLFLFVLICMCLGVQSMDVLQCAYPGMPQSDSWDCDAQPSLAGWNGRANEVNWFSVASTGLLPILSSECLWWNNPKSESKMIHVHLSPVWGTTWTAATGRTCWSTTSCCIFVLYSTSYWKPRAKHFQLNLIVAWLRLKSGKATVEASRRVEQRQDCVSVYLLPSQSDCVAQRQLCRVDSVALFLSVEHRPNHILAARAWFWLQCNGDTSADLCRLL